MNRIIKYSTIAFTFLLMGCYNINKIDMPTQKPTIIETPYSKIRYDINQMIAVFYGKPINILVDTIENKTKERARLPLDISDIVNTSFNGIGKNVNTIANPNKVTDNLKAYIIHGAITEYDVLEEKSNGTNIDIELKNGKIVSSGELSRESKVTKLAINFNPEDVNSGSFVTQASTANRITIYQKNSASEFGFSILGTGFGRNISITKSQGVHSSITTLVDLSVAEVLGKIAIFPYWLLTKGSIDRRVLNELSDEFLDDKLPNKIYKISYLLYLKYKTVQPTMVMNNRLEKVIKEYKKAHGMRENIYLSQEFYRSLLGG